MIRHLISKALKWHHMKRDPTGFARSIGVQIGEDCRLIDLRPGTFGSEPYLIKLGNHVTITSGVQFITHDGGVWVFREKHPDIDVVAPISIEDNVFVGLNAIIMPGVTIGRNCVVGAGAVVTRDVPADSVVAGVPARVIGSRDDYWEKTQAKAMYIRSLPLPERQRLFEQHFFGKGDLRS